MSPFQVGYNTGLHWTDKWTPGGPWVYRGLDKAIAAESQKEHDDWMDGFRQGLEAQSVYKKSQSGLEQSIFSFS